MTTTEPTNEERIVVIPEVTISASSGDAAAKVLELVEELRPQLEELHAEAMKVRDESDQALVALWPVLGDHAGRYLTDEMTELAEMATGWGETWQACRWIGDLFGDGPGERFGTIGLEVHEIARGGERDIARDTVATIATGDEGKPVTVRVLRGPSHPLADGGYVVRDVDGEREYVVSHDKLKAALNGEEAQR